MTQSVDVFRGRDHALYGQFNRGSYGALPTGTNANRLKFTTVSLDRAPVYNKDATISADTVLQFKQDEIDESPKGSLTTIACLNEARYWMQCLFNSPVTTGSAAPYTHTYTVAPGNVYLKDMMLEMVANVPGSTGKRIRRFVGAMVNKFTWDVLAEEQNFQMDLLMARRVQPNPTAQFDSTPSFFAKARARASTAAVYDVSGSSTLGRVTGCTVTMDLGLSPQRVADGLSGYGEMLPGQPSIGGTISVLYENGGIHDYAEQQTTRRLVISTSGPSGESMTWTLPNVVFDENPLEVGTVGGLVRTFNWTAFDSVGGSMATCVLVNSVSGTSISS